MALIRLPPAIKCPRAIKYPANDRPLKLYPLEFSLPGVRGRSHSTLRALCGFFLFVLASPSTSSGQAWRFSYFFSPPLCGLGVLAVHFFKPLAPSLKPQKSRAPDAPGERQAPATGLYSGAMKMPPPYRPTTLGGYDSCFLRRPWTWGGVPPCAVLRLPSGGMVRSWVVS